MFLRLLLIILMISAPAISPSSDTKEDIEEVRETTLSINDAIERYAENLTKFCSDHEKRGFESTIKKQARDRYDALTAESEKERFRRILSDLYYTGECCAPFVRVLDLDLDAAEAVVERAKQLAQRKDELTGLISMVSDADCRTLEESLKGALAGAENLDQSSSIVENIFSSYLRKKQITEAVLKGAPERIAQIKDLAQRAGYTSELRYIMSSSNSSVYQELQTYESFLKGYDGEEALLQRERDLPRIRAEQERLDAEAGARYAKQQEESRLLQDISFFISQNYGTYLEKELQVALAGLDSEGQIAAYQAFVAKYGGPNELYKKTQEAESYAPEKLVYFANQAGLNKEFEAIGQSRLSPEALFLAYKAFIEKYGGIEGLIKMAADKKAQPSSEDDSDSDDSEDGRSEKDATPPFTPPAPQPKKDIPVTEQISYKPLLGGLGASASVMLLNVLYFWNHYQHNPTDASGKAISFKKYLAREFNKKKSFYWLTLGCGAAGTVCAVGSGLKYAYSK